MPVSPEASGHTPVNIHARFLESSEKYAEPGQQTELSYLYDLINGIKLSVDQHKVFVDKQISALTAKVSTIEDNIKETIVGEVRAAKTEIQNYIDTEIGRLAGRIDVVERKISEIEENKHSEYDPDVSIIMSKVAVTPDEDIQKIVEEIIHEALEKPEIPVVRAMRLRQRDDTPRRAGQGQAPPLIKVQLRTVADKVAVLRVKRRLKDSAKYSSVFMRSSKPHAERVMDMNFRT